MKEKITIKQAYAVMTDFLEKYWKKTDCDEIACLLSDMNTNLWADGSTADPAIWGEWEESVFAVAHNAEKISSDQAFQAMSYFLSQYIPFQTPEECVTYLLEGVKMINGVIANPIFQKEWLLSVKIMSAIERKKNEYLA